MAEETYQELLDEYLARSNNEFVNFSFLHYENAGELVAKYRYDPRYTYNKSTSQWEEVPADALHSEFEYKDPSDFPSFFGQGEFRLRPLRLNTSDYENFLYEKSAWMDGITTVPSMRFTHNSDGITTTLTDLNNKELRGMHDVYFGEFFLLSNNYKGIKRFNLKSELLQGDINGENFVRERDAFKYPSHTAKGMNNAFVQWYFGQSPISDKQRPEFLKVGRITPTIANPIHTESRRRWMAMRESCLGWNRIYDKSNLGFDLANRTLHPKSTICTVKAIIDFDKLREFLEEQFTHETYRNGRESYDIILYPPSLYMYPADSVIKVIEPIVNSINTFTDKIIFEAPDSFKTDGNFHYSIDFYRSESDDTPFYSTSSYLGDDDFEYGRWLKSDDEMENWDLMSADTPSFDNTFELEAGTDAIFTTHIKYVLTEKLFELVRDSPTVVFRINQLDGTLVHFNGRRFSFKYINET